MGGVWRGVTPAGDPAWVVAEYSTVKALLADRRLGRTHPDPGTAARYSESVIFGPPLQETPTSAAEHQRMRKLLGPWFSARNLEQLRPRVRELVVGLLDQLAAREPPVDFHQAVSFPLPALVICELLGVPYEDQDAFRGWSEDTANMTDQARSIAGYQQLANYISGLIVAKLDAPSNDVLSSLGAAHRADPEGFPLVEAAQMGGGLLFAGHETTVASIDTGILLLAQNPEQRDALRRAPEQIPAAVEEILRSALPLPAPPDSAPSIEGGSDNAVSGSRGAVGRSEDAAGDDAVGADAPRARGLPRWAKSPIDVDGVTIAAGDLVVLDLQRANDDREVTRDRPGFDVTRQPNPHVTFGHGPYFCIGAPLARLELQVLFTELLTRFPNLTVAVPRGELKARTTQFTGGVESLPATW